MLFASQALVKTSLQGLSTARPVACARDGPGHQPSYSPHSVASPALSTASTAHDDDQDIESSPSLSLLPTPSLPPHVAEILRTPPPGSGEFGTASWGSPYPSSDHNLRRSSLGSDQSDESPIHHLSLETPFLRPQPAVFSSDPVPQSSLSAAAAVLATRARRQDRGLTEGWIRTHTTGIVNIEPKHWFSDGSESDHSSLSVSESACVDSGGLRTPRAASKDQPPSSASQPRRSRRRSSIETLKPTDLFRRIQDEAIDMAADNPPAPVVRADLLSGSPRLASTLSADTPNATPVVKTSEEEARSKLDGPKFPVTPIKGAQKPLPKTDSAATKPRIKKKVPWRAKNICIMVPRDDERGLPGKSSMPLRADEIEGMFASWKQLGYSVDGFDLFVDDYHTLGTAESQSRRDWPASEDMARERAERRFKVTLPDLNAWKQYVNKLQEAKLRALGVSFAEAEPEAPSISPPTSNPSRQPSAQYPSLSFSPPVPTSSASSNHAVAGYPFTGQYVPSTQSPGLPSGASPVPFAAVPSKLNPHQSISLPAGSPYQLPQSSPKGWPDQSGIMPALNRKDSPSPVNLNSILSPQSPYGMDGLQQTGSPALNMHQKHQSLQFLPPHMTTRVSPRLRDVIEEEDAVSKSPSATPGPTRQNPDGLQAEIDDAEYHLEEQLRHQLEHEDYNPQTRAGDGPVAIKPLALGTGDVPRNLAVVQSFASEPDKPLVLHHPRPHSRGQSVSKSFFRDHDIIPESADEASQSKLGALVKISETLQDDESQEIETNPSNLGTPVKDFDFAKLLPHEVTLPTTGNSWRDSTSVPGSGRGPSHGSKSSFSKLNVGAPEFKFNPPNSFAPGPVNSSSMNALSDTSHATHHSRASIASFGGPARFHATTPSFALSQSYFSFSATGPKFRPEAPAFMPVHRLSGTVTSLTGSGSGHAGKRSSIFGNVDIRASDIVKPARKSKAIPIVRPSSRSSVHSQGPSMPAGKSVEQSEDRDQNGRATRAWSAAPDGDDVPLFAQRPDEAGVKVPVTDASRDDHSSAEDGSTAEGDNALPADTSLSSIVTSDRAETKATTAASSEMSPDGEDPVNNGTPFDIGSKIDPQAYVEARKIGDKPSKTYHKKSLSATAKPFVSADEREADKRATNVIEPTVSTDTMPVPYKLASPYRRAKLTPKGLLTFRFTSPLLPSPEVENLMSFEFARPISSLNHRETQPNDNKPMGEKETIMKSVEKAIDQEPTSPPVSRLIDIKIDREPTFEEIDAIMQHLAKDPSRGVNRSIERSLRQPPTAIMEPDVSRNDLQLPADGLAMDRTSLTPRQQDIAPELPPMSSTEMEDPFLDPPLSSHSPAPDNELDDIESRSEMTSDWEAAFSADEQEKLETRAQFFDGHVNKVVGNLLASRLEPLEKTLFTIKNMVAKSRRTPSSRRDMRSISIELQPSDADDEDEEPAPQRSASPRRDRRMEQIRIAVMEAIAVQQGQQTVTFMADELVSPGNDSAVLKLLEQIKEQLALVAPSAREDQSTVHNHEPVVRDQSALEVEEKLLKKLQELRTEIATFEDRLNIEQSKEKEIAQRRAAEDEAAELHRKLQAAETRVEVEIINRSVFDQRAADLEERLRLQEEKNEQEIKSRRAAEDRLSEVQRLLRISSEEETRLHRVLEDKNQRIKSFEQDSSNVAMRMALLEAAQSNSTLSQSDMTNKVNALETDLRAVRQDNNHWRAEAERADEVAHRKAGELAHALQENQQLQRLQTTTTQLEETERLRELWRTKFMSLQDDLGRAAREIAEENARRIKKDQAMFARHEVLDARLQAEAKTRERLEVEMERLQNNERSGMRAVNECKRLEALLSEMRSENHKLHQVASRYQREFEEARESGASQVKRTRLPLQTEIETANEQVNVVREELEEQNAKLRAELDNVKLAADTAKAQNEMLLEDAQIVKVREMKEVKRAYQSELEDIQTRYERQISTTSEEAQRAEQQLLERLSLSASNTEHLQDRVVHLEDKLEIAKQAAAAAAQAAKSAPAAAAVASAVTRPQPALRKLDVPEKISLQALRESIMVLQEQLQAREQRIEELEQVAATVDPDAASKISKRDDEISWLRELLAVRHADLQDIISALSGERYNGEAVRDAAIRLKANLQMEEQERERAMNGGSAISLPNIAQSIQAATPRVAQKIGPIATAWGNWRKSTQPSLRSRPMAHKAAISSNSRIGQSATPSRHRDGGGSQHSLPGGLLTPPASGLRQIPLDDGQPQPTAFASTGRRYTAQSSGPSRARGESSTSRRSERALTIQGTPPCQPERREPMTPPMMGRTGYDSDAQPGDFDDQDFFDDEE